MNDLLSLDIDWDQSDQQEHADPAYWFGQHADNWPTGNGIAFNTDGNGDGAITSADIVSSIIVT
jgi:hypothetical protein